MIKKTTSPKTLFFMTNGIKTLLLTLLLTLTAFNLKGAELTTFSLTSSSVLTRDTTILTFTYQIVTASPDMVLYASLPAASNTQWLILDSVKVKINGTPATINATLSEATGKSLKVTLNNPTLATAGSDIEVTAYAINGTVEGNFSWGFIRTANTDGTSVDQVTSTPTFSLLPQTPEIPVPNNATNIKDSSFITSWNDVEYAYGYVLEVSKNNIFTDYATGYNNLDVFNVQSKLVTGLDANTTYYYRVRAYNITGTSERSNYITVTTPKKQQTITFNALPESIYGDADLDLTASASSGLTVSYISSDPTVAAISAGKIQILKVGTSTITASQAGNSEYLPATSVPQLLTVSPKTLTLTGTAVESKIYDGSAAAVISTLGTLTGIVNTDDVTLDSSAASATFPDKNIGDDKVVTIAGIILAGTAMSNYSLTVPTTMANITIKSLSLIGITAANKVYDGNSNAAISSFGTLTGVVDGDDVTVSTLAESSVFADKNVADNKVVTLTGLVLQGADKDNYSLDAINAISANITTKSLTIEANDDISFTNESPYSGGNGVSYSGFVAGEDQTVLSGTLTYGGNSQGASMEGTYDITPQGLTSQNYAIAFVDGVLTIYPEVGIETEIFSSLDVYPNPFGSTLYLNNATQIGQISINNIVGQEVLKIVNNGSEMISIQTSELENGIYIVIFESVNGEHLTKKMIKK